MSERELRERSTALNSGVFTGRADLSDLSKTTVPHASWAQNGHSRGVQLDLPGVTAALFLEAAEALTLRAIRGDGAAVSIDAIRRRASDQAQAIASDPS